MKPEKLQRRNACLQEAASILYEETPSEELLDKDAIEKAVRRHCLEQVGPQIALFLSAKPLVQNKVNSDK